MKQVLLVSIGFSPNVGGIETHFDDLVKGLVKRKWAVTVLTYQPLTSDRKAPYMEYRPSVDIYRIPLFRGLFYTLVHTPILEFLYLTPGLFFALPILLLKKGSSISVIHSHGLIAGFVSVFWGKIFGKKVITTTHSLYEFPENGLYRRLAQWIFGSSDRVLCLSEQSVCEIKSLGVSPLKITRFVYWIDSNLFNKVLNAKKKLHLNAPFVVLFVGRLVQEKGVAVLLESTKKWPETAQLLIAGLGPLERTVKNYAEKNDTKVSYVGKINQQSLPLYYSAADVFIMPSLNEEGFGRVIIESLLCGTPVVGSRRGAIPEAMDESVGVFITPTKVDISKEITTLLKNKTMLRKKSAAARPFALKRYSEKNIEVIIESYSS